MQPLSATARPAVRALCASMIREVANTGIGRQDIVAFWSGEPDEVTPGFIRQAAVDALNAGDTFYTHNPGIPELRQAVAGYLTGLHRVTQAEDVAITNSGMSALMLSAQALIGHGDRVVAVTPLWPNLVEIPKVLGAMVETVALRFTLQGWKLDLDNLLHALTSDTRVVLINSPNNPTGWTIDCVSQRAILEHCRRHGIWIIARTAARLRNARDYLEEQLNATPGVQPAPPAGAMYDFFRLHGVDDSLALCKKPVSNAGLVLAPGIAFGPEGEGFVRWCFAASEERLAEGMRRLRGALGGKHR